MNGRFGKVVAQQWIEGFHGERPEGTALPTFTLRKCCAMDECPVS